MSWLRKLDFPLCLKCNAMINIAINHQLEGIVLEKNHKIVSNLLSYLNLTLQLINWWSKKPNLTNRAQSQLQIRLRSQATSFASPRNSKKAI